MVARKITDFAKMQAIYMHSNGHSYQEIADELGHSKSSIHYLVKKYEETGSINDRYRPGRPKISNERDDRQLVRLIRKNRQATSLELSKKWILSNGKTASPSTVRRRSVFYGYDWKQAAKKPRLSKKQKKARKEWCNRVKSWNQDVWRKVIFSDEMNIEVDNRKNRIMLRRMAHEKYNEDCIVKRTKQGSGSIGIWACMNFYGVGFFRIFDGRLNAVRYIEILGDELKRSIEKLHPGGEVIFQQDGAPCHTAKITKKHLADNNITTIPWPANSPDLNCIENLWSWLDRQIQKQEPRSKNDLIAIVEKLLQNVPQDIVENLSDSMPRRINECLKNGGGMTRY